MRQRWTVAVLLPLVLLAVAGTVRFYRLTEPPEIYFDETYYVEDARAMREHGVEPSFVVHPPVGKLLIAGGMAVFGDRPFGWRFASAAVGTLTVLVVYLAGVRLLARRALAALAALAVALDGLALTSSRITMLDAPLALFTTTGFALLLVARDDERLRWRALAGLAFGLALATKWSAVFTLAAALLFVAVVELARRPGWRRLAVAGATTLLTLVVVPLAVYLASYAGWFANVEATRRAGDLGDASPGRIAEVWVDEQRQIYRFHRDLEVTHPYQSDPATWLVLARPVAYHWEDEGEGSVEHVLGMGNPALWWLAFLALPLLLFFAVRDADWRPAAVLLFFAAQYVPWLVAARPLFLFYMVPAVPFLALAVAMAAGSLGRRWPAAGVAVAVTGAFVFWYPVWSALEMSRASWNLRILFATWI